MRGRPRKPTVLKLLRGNPGKRKLPVNEPKPAVGARPPSWLPLAARREWDAMAPMYLRLGLLTELSAPAFAELCCARVKFRAVVRSEGGRIPTELWRAIQALDAKFGGTPADLARIEVKPQQPEGKLGRYLGQS